MKKTILLLLLLLPILMMAQNISITDDESYTADSSAMLDVKSDTKGFLVPRLTNTQIGNINEPATGLLVFNTSLNKFSYYTGSEWIILNAGNPDNLWALDDSLIYINDSLAHFGIGTYTPTGKLEVRADQSIGDNDPLFEVKNHAGDPVFAVYPNSVQVYVDETTKGNIGGFAVSGRSASKAVNEYMVITPDSTRIYIDTASAKGNIGGFAVSGRSASKSALNDYLQITPSKTHVYVDEETAKGNIGGFAVSGRSASKAEPVDLFVSTPDSTRIYIDQPAKGNIGGFAVSGRSASKAANNFLDLTPENYFIGEGAGQANTEGQFNSFIGYQAGFNNDEGSWNTFLGYQAGYFNFGLGSDNTFIGYKAGYAHEDRGGNVYIGSNAGAQTQNGEQNIFIGEKAGYQNGYGDQNIMIGFEAGFENAGKGNVFIGYQSGKYMNGANENYRLSIDSRDSIETYLPPLIYGEFDSDNGNKRCVVIEGDEENNSSDFGFYVNSDAGGLSGWNSKITKSVIKNQKKISQPLEKVKNLEGMVYTRTDAKERKMLREKSYGLDFEKAEKIIPELVTETKDAYSVAYGPISVLLIEAMKEQQKQIDTLSQQVQKLIEENKKLRTAIENR